MAVEVEKPPIRGGFKPLYIDLGVRCLTTLWAKGWRQTVAFSGNQLLHDWWYWMKRIAKTQSRLVRVNRAKTSRRLRRLYRMRQRRFRYAVNAMIKAIIEKAVEEGFTEIIIGYLKGIRNSNSECRKAIVMIDSFWSFDYITKRLREKAEEHGIRIREVSERQTSSICPRCNSEECRRHKRLFKCLKCGLEAHRDVIGVLNIAYLHEEEGEAIRVMAHPLLLKWDGMRWNRKSGMNTRPMKTLEAENLPTLVVESVNGESLIKTFNHIFTELNSKKEDWKFLSLFDNKARVDMLNIFLKFERLSLSDIARELERKGWRMKLPAVVKHVKKLEEAGILRSESGSLSEEPDARKTIYILKGRERVEAIMNHLKNIRNLVESGLAFNETAKAALRIQSSGGRAAREEIERLKSLLATCESEEVNKHLTEEEKENIKLWKMVLTMISGKYLSTTHG